MPPKKSGRAAAEAAYANLLKEQTALVGDVGAHYEAYRGKLEAAVGERDRYEQARAAAIKAGAITNDQLEQLGYKKTPRLPGLPGPVGANGHAPSVRTPRATPPPAPAAPTASAASSQAG